MTCTLQTDSTAGLVPDAVERRTDLAPIADRGLLRAFVRTLGGDSGELAESEESPPITLWQVRKGATLLHEGASAQSLYVLRSGSLKIIRTLEDGYEQVLSFAQPGELLGFEALHCGHQPAGAVALEHCTVFALPLQGLRAWRQQRALLDDALQRALSRQLVRAAGTAEMMAAVAADVRLARFLLWMSMRMTECGQSPRRLYLRMGRRDIASLLGVAHETVSRAFGALSDSGLVKVDNRDVEILDLERLRLHSRSTRGAIDALGALRRPPVAAAPVAWFPQPAAVASA